MNSVTLSGLSEEIKKKKSNELDKAFTDYKSALKGFGNWTIIAAESKSEHDNLITICIDGTKETSHLVLLAAGSI